MVDEHRHKVPTHNEKKVGMLAISSHTCVFQVETNSRNTDVRLESQVEVVGGAV